MKKHIVPRNSRPVEFPPLPLWVEGNVGFFDPLGSYTGRPENTDEIPVQDADDL